MIYSLIFLFFSSICKAETKLAWSGDVRVRGQSETNLPGEDRISQKLRARLSLKAEMDPKLRAEIRIATAKANSSTNQTMGDNKEPGMPRRFMGLDLAYAEWRPIEPVKFQAGRVPQSHDRPGGSQILLDADLALEGAAIITDYAFTPEYSLRMSWGSAWLRENYDTFYSEEQADNMLNWGQISADWKQEDFTLTAGTGFFNFYSLQGTLFSDITVGGSARGNSQEPVGAYKDNFVPRQYFLELKTKIGDYNVGVFSEYIVNGETLDPNRASWGGFSIGQDKWSSQLAYVTLDSDSVPGVFTDSDFAGGATDSRGSIFNLQWKFRKKMSVGLLQIWSFKRTEFGDTRYDRTHLDLSASF